MDPLDEVLLSRLGQTIAGRWTLASLIGSGGMAAVYAATNPDGQSAAIKLLYPEMGIRKDIRERFLREAAVMARVQHPGMVAIYEQGQSGDLVYLAMELLHGETIAARVRRLGRLDPNEVLVILDQVLDVLSVAHSIGIVHRDLKPENLFLTQAGQIKVLDFGLARLLDAAAESFRTRTGAALGTLPYMAPEQALGRRDEIDARTDLFAVGATAYRLLSGHRIHEAPSEAELLMLMASEPAKPLLKIAPDLSVDVATVVDRALAFARSRRYPDAVTMQRDVRALAAGQRPEYALTCQEHEDSATNVDRVAPRSSATAPLPNSTRPLQAALGAGVAPPDPLPHNVTPTALDPLTAPPVHAAVPASHRVLPVTIAMPASRRDAATVADPIAVAQPTPVMTGPALHGASIPIAPISDAVLERRRRQTVAVGFLLLFGMLGVATAGAWYLVTRSSEAKLDPNATSARAVATSLPGAQLSRTEQVAAESPMRHPAQLIAPEDDPVSNHDAATSAPRRPHSGHSIPTSTAAAPTVVSPAPNQQQSNLLPTSQVVAAPIASGTPAQATPPPMPVQSPTSAPPVAASTAMPPPHPAAQPSSVPPPPNASAPGQPPAKPKTHGKHKR